MQGRLNTIRFKFLTPGENCQQGRLHATFSDAVALSTWVGAMLASDEYLAHEALTDGLFNDRLRKVCSALEEFQSDTEQSIRLLHERLNVIQDRASSARRHLDETR